MGAKGTIDIDFGSAPGTNYIVTSVTGQTEISSVTSAADAFLMADSTASHNSYEHSIAPIQLVCGNIVTGTGFDIIATSEHRLTGVFKVHWVWA